MNAVNLSYFEKLVATSIKRKKPKKKQRGYIKELIAKLYPTIEQALSDGLEYEDIAEAISENNLKISPITLKQYHLANRNLHNKAQDDEKSNTLPSDMTEPNPNGGESDEMLQESSTNSLKEVVSYDLPQEMNKMNDARSQNSLVEKLSNSSLDDDFFDDADDSSDFVKPYVRRGN
jgi:hypothetical protein